MIFFWWGGGGGGGAKEKVLASPLVYVKGEVSVDMKSILIPKPILFHWLPGGGVQHLTNPQENCSDNHSDARDSHMDVRFGAGDWQRN